MSDGPKTSVLTPKQREFLEKGGDGAGARMTRKRIRERTRQAFRDFSLLADALDDQERNKIFDVERQSEEYRTLGQHLADVIQFIYTGVGSSAEFEDILRTGVRNGEVDLGHVEIALYANVTFDIEHVTPHSMEATAEHIKNNEWNEITAADALGFIRAAKSGSISFDVDTILEEREMMKERLQEQRKTDSSD